MERVMVRGILFKRILRRLLVSLALLMVIIVCCALVVYQWDRDSKQHDSQLIVRFPLRPKGVLTINAVPPESDMISTTSHTAPFSDGEGWMGNAVVNPRNGELHEIAAISHQGYTADVVLRVTGHTILLYDSTRGLCRMKLPSSKTVPLPVLREQLEAVRLFHDIVAGRETYDFKKERAELRFVDLKTRSRIAPAAEDYHSKVVEVLKGNKQFPLILGTERKRSWEEDYSTRYVLMKSDGSTAYRVQMKTGGSKMASLTPQNLLVIAGDDTVWVWCIGDLRPRPVISFPPRTRIDYVAALSRGIVIGASNRITNGLWDLLEDRFYRELGRFQGTRHFAIDRYPNFNRHMRISLWSHSGRKIRDLIHDVNDCMISDDESTLYITRGAELRKVSLK